MRNRLANKISLAAFLALAMIACSSAATNINVNTANNSVNMNSSNAVAQTSPTPPADAAQKNTAPDALVADLYKQHDAKKSPFFQDKDRALVDKYFTKATADLIWKDATDAKGEVGALNADPLYDAQDTEIKNFKVGQADIKDKRAKISVSFENFGEKRRVEYLLVTENGNWKIDDIEYMGDYTLVGMLKDDSGNEKETSATGEFEGKYQVGDTTCTVKPIKMAFEVKWEKGSGTEIFFAEGRANDKYIFASQPKTGKANVFSFDDENYNTGIFYRADGKEFPIKRVK